jgi:Spy/CpxP family protein refolding chaperone
MKRPIIAALALLTFALPVAAQQRMGGGPPQSGAGIFSGITLTPAQQKQVDSLYASNQPMRDKMRAQMESGQRPDSAQMVTLRAQRAKILGSYRGFLTPDQQKVFDKNVAEMQARMESMGAAAGASERVGAVPPAGAGAGAGQGASPKP